MERVLRYDYRELVPLLRHRDEPDQSGGAAGAGSAAQRAHVDRRAAASAGGESLRNAVEEAGQTKGAAVVMDPATGDLLAAVSFPLPDESADADEDNPYLDRARYGLYPPGSTFKVVTAMAALRKDAGLAKRTYRVQRLPDGRVGNYLKGSKRPIRDDVRDIRRTARWIWSAGSRVLQRVLRAVGHVRGGRRGVARYGDAAGDRGVRRIRRRS